MTSRITLPYRNPLAPRSQCITILFDDGFSAVLFKPGTGVLARATIKMSDDRSDPAGVDGLSQPQVVTEYVERPMPRELCELVACV